VRVAKPYLSRFDDGVGIAELSLSLAQRLDLGAEQLDPALEAVEQLELVPRPAVRGNVA
jgi:hypothetical protein